MKKLIILISAIACVGFCADLQSSQVSGASINQADGGSIRAEYFYYNHAGAAPSNRVIDLVKVPSHARIVKGVVSISAQGGAQIFDLGMKATDGSGYINRARTIADTANLFLNDIACSNATVDTFADLELGDTNPNYASFEKDVYVTLSTLGGVPWATNTVVSGVVYFIDP